MTNQEFNQLIETLSIQYKSPARKGAKPKWTISSVETTYEIVQNTLMKNGVLGIEIDSLLAHFIDDNTEEPTKEVTVDMIVAREILKFNDTFPLRWTLQDNTLIWLRVIDINTKTVSPYFKKSDDVQRIIQSDRKLSKILLDIMQVCKDEGVPCNVESCALSINNFLINSRYFEKYMTPCLDDIKFITDNTKQWNFGYFDPTIFDIEDISHPTWDPILARMDHPDIFKAWLWTVFDADNKNRQTLWLSGEGFDGKSFITKAVQGYLTKHNSKLVQSIQIKNDDNFIYSRVYGARLIIAADVKKEDVLGSEFIHTVTGDDFVRVEAKGQDGFTARMFIKVWVCANMMPSVNLMDTNERTRILIVNIRGTGEDVLRHDVKGWESDTTRLETEALLLAEMDHLIADCKRSYKKLVNAYGLISWSDEYETSMSSMAKSELQVALEDFADAHFELDPMSKLSRSATSKIMRDELTNSKLTSGNKTLAELWKILCKKGAMHKKIDGVHVLAGIKLKNVLKNATVQFESKTAHKNGIKI